MGGKKGPRPETPHKVGAVDFISSLLSTPTGTSPRKRRNTQESAAHPELPELVQKDAMTNGIES